MAIVCLSILSILTLVGAYPLARYSVSVPPIWSNDLVDKYFEGSVKVQSVAALCSSKLTDAYYKVETQKPMPSGVRKFNNAVFDPSKNQLRILTNVQQVSSCVGGDSIFCYNIHADGYGFFLNNPWGINYQHWIIEVLPNIWFYRKLKACHPSLELVMLPVDENDSYKSEFILALLGKTEIHYLKEPKLYGSLYFPGFLCFNGGWKFEIDYIPQESFSIFEEIRQLYHVQNVQKSRNKCFIKRTDAANGVNRALVNAQDIENKLLDAGFIARTLSKMSIGEKAEFLKGCEFIVTEMGAGLTNVLFMPKGSHLIVLCGPLLCSNFFRLFTDRWGISHYHIVGDLVNSTRPDAWKGTQNLPWVIDTQSAFERIMQIIHQDGKNDVHVINVDTSIGVASLSKSLFIIVVCIFLFAAFNKLKSV